MPDYGKGVIYTIRCKTDDTLIYVGSTIQPLYKRLYAHKVTSKEEKNKNRLIYQTINNDWDNWYIELYELYPCSCKNELCRKEGEVIRLIGNLNNRIAGRTQQEWNQENKERIAEGWKVNYEKNKERIAERWKVNYEKNKEKILEQAKVNYEKNKEKISAYYKQHYINNKEQYQKKYQQKKIEKQNI